MNDLRKQITSFNYMICLFCLSVASPARAGITYPGEARQISTTTGLRPQIAIDPQDRGTIVYEHNNYVWAVRVQADGTASIPVQISEQSKPSSQVALYPETVVDSQGISTVVWARIDPASGNSVGEFVRLDVQGNVISAAQQFSSNTYQPELAIDAQGRVTVVWGDFGTIRAMRIASNGGIGATNVLAPGQNIAGGEVNGKHRMALTADAQGRVSVIWAAADSSGSKVVVKGRTIAADGSTLGTVQEISSSGLFFIGALDSAVAPDGRVSVIWHQTIVRSGDGQIFMRTLDPTGVATGAPVRLNSLSGKGSTPRIEANGFGRWLAVWAAQGSAELRQETRLIDSSGNPGTITAQSQAGAYSNRAEIKADSCGRWVMQWESSSDGTSASNAMFAARLDSGGVMQGAPVMISSVGGVGEIHDLAVDSRANALHVWTSGVQKVLLSRGVDNGSLEGCYAGGVSDPFNQWRIHQFDSVQLDDPATSGRFGDADKDGIVNLIEYGIGSDPNDPSEGPALVALIQVDVGGIMYPALSFNRLKTELDPSLQIKAEVATGDFNWLTGSGNTVEFSNIPLDAARNRVVIRSTFPVSSKPRQMMRLRFTLIP